MFLPLLKIKNQQEKTDLDSRISSYLLFFLQTEEDYIPYPSVHEVHVTYCASAFYAQKMQSLLCFDSFIALLFFPIRCLVVLGRFHSSFCPSLVATGSRGLIMSLKSHQNLISLHVLPPISNWRQTALPKYTESIS